MHAVETWPNDSRLACAQVIPQRLQTISVPLRDLGDPRSRFGTRHREEPPIQQTMRIGAPFFKREVQLGSPTRVQYRKLLRILLQLLTPGPKRMLKVCQLVEHAFKVWQFRKISIRVRGSSQVQFREHSITPRLSFVLKKKLQIIKAPPYAQ